MSLKHYFIALGAGTFLAFLSMVVVLTRVNPAHIIFWGPALFYLSLFLTVVGLYAMGGFVWRVKVVRQSDVLFRQVKKTFRQGCLFGAVAVASLMLLHVGYLRWWSITLIIVITLGIELHTLTREEHASAAHRPHAALR